MSGQNIKTYYVPKAQQARRDLNKRLKKEQEPSLKNKAKGIGKAAINLLRGAHKVTSDYIEDNRESQKKLARIISHVDDGFKNMGPSMRNTWVNPDKPVVVKEEKKNRGEEKENKEGEIK